MPDYGAKAGGRDLSGLSFVDKTGFSRLEAVGLDVSEVDMDFDAWRSTSPNERE
jgi:hypothetical protein